MKKALILALILFFGAAPAHAVPTPLTDNGFPTGGTGGIHPMPAGAALQELFQPGLTPVGANDFSCKPAKGQRPVILIPGTTGSAFNSFSGMAPVLKGEGLCVFTFNHNPLGFSSQVSFAGDIADSARMLGTVVDKVLESTGAEQVDLVGWSQGGGPLPVFYINKLGGAEKVHKVVGVVPSHHGTNFWLVHDYAQRNPAVRADFDNFGAAVNGLALAQQLAGSEFMNDLYSEPVRAEYMNIATQFDQIVLPYSNSYLEGSDNRLVQDYCPGRQTTHLNATYDPVVHALVLEGLSGVPRPKNCAAPVPVI
ncbi:lipase family alpha/beta hydrolase [Corynebacterium sp. H130]|uniref:lipase family alpha/beta hydrolase n=1 Tax=Corynebacterium sp. H130 TaxID=3133444 RepID=UPI00309FA579